METLRARLLDAIEALAEGFALFDCDDRLVMCNSVYQRYFSELADIVNSGMSFGEIIEAAVERGMFPEAEGQEQEWIAALLERRRQTTGTRQQHMRSGLWLQVRELISDCPSATTS